MGSKWDPLIGKLFGAFPVLAAMALAAIEADISAEKIRSVQKSFPSHDSIFLADRREIAFDDESIRKDGKLIRRLTFQSGRVEEGNFVNNRLQGWGRSVLANGTEVEGEHVDGVPHGIARAVTKKGLIQEGEFVQGVLHGRGSILGNGWGVADTVTTGFWKHGVRHGPGRKIAPYVYSEGECVNGEQRGLWTYVFKNKTKLEGRHDASSFIDDFRLFWASFG